jgi:hypothetical protein
MYYENNSIIFYTSNLFKGGPSVAQTILNEEELNMLLSPGYHLEEIKQPRRLRLTMKYLYQLIGQIQHEKQLLSLRVDELEQQLYELYLIREEEASTQEMLNIAESPMKETIEKENKPALPELIEITRSERHPKPKKTTFWDFLLRR